MKPIISAEEAAANATEVLNNRYNLPRILKAFEELIKQRMIYGEFDSHIDVGEYTRRNFLGRICWLKRFKAISKSLKSAGYRLKFYTSSPSSNYRYLKISWKKHERV